MAERRLPRPRGPAQLAKLIARMIVVPSLLIGGLIIGASDSGAAESCQVAKQRGQTLIAKNTLIFIPEAFVCEDIPGFDALSNAYQSYWGDRENRKRFSARDADMYLGKTPAAPDPRLYRCTMIPAGTQMRLVDCIGGMQIVSVDPMGVKGVTGPWMIDPPLAPF